MTAKPRRPVAVRASESAAPVFILTPARSGSTLLRYLLDAHPELACPAETGLPHLGHQLATVWAAISGAAKPSPQPDSVAAIPESIIEQVRAAIDPMIGQYLGDRGKRRFCDKTLGAAKHADLLIRLYPDVRFIGLVRHAMDFIASAVDADRWGPIGYGFDEYVAGGSGNMVRNLATYWIDHTSAIASVALRHPGRTFLVRYEDLVEAPEVLASKIFGFLGVTPQPGITGRCLRVKGERLSQGDHKVWWTSEITSDSVGRGQAVPPVLLTPPVADQVNTLLSQLSYVRVEATWGTAHSPADPREPGSGPSADQCSPKPKTPAVARPVLEERLRLGLSKVDESFTTRWLSCSADTFACVARSPATPDDDACWQVDLSRRTLSLADVSGYQWCIVGEHGAWDAVLSGRTDLGTSLRRSELRYCEGTPLGSPAASSRSAEVPVAEDRLDMVGDLLGLTPWLASRSVPLTH
jgi:hypothetical protein